MKKYVKPVAVLDEDLAEGVYAVSGGALGGGSGETDPDADYNPPVLNMDAADGGAAPGILGGMAADATEADNIDAPAPVAAPPQIRFDNYGTVTTGTDLVTGNQTGSKSFLVTVTGDTKAAYIMFRGNLTGASAQGASVRFNTDASGVSMMNMLVVTGFTAGQSFVLNISTNDIANWTVIGTMFE